jgi:hypothetical protein
LLEFLILEVALICLLGLHQVISVALLLTLLFYKLLFVSL